MDAADHEPEAGPPGVGGEVAERGPALEHRVLGRPDPADLEEVVHDPDRVEAGLVGLAGDAGEGGADRRRPAGVVEAVELEADLHGGERTPGGRARAERPCSAVRDGRAAACPRLAGTRRQRKRSVSGGMRTSARTEPSPGGGDGAPDERDRPSGGLAEDELGGRGDLVGDGADGGGHDAPVGVRRAAQVLERAGSRPRRSRGR